MNPYSNIPNFQFYPPIQGQTNGGVQYLPPTTNLNQPPLNFMFTNQGAPQFFPPRVNVCAVCSRPCPYPGILVAADALRGIQLYACSVNCENQWNSALLNYQKQLSSRTQPHPFSALHQPMKGKHSNRQNAKKNQKNVNDRTEQKQTTNFQRPQVIVETADNQKTIPKQTMPNPQTKTEPNPLPKSPQSTSSEINENSSAFENQTLPVIATLPVKTEEELYVVIDTNTLITHMLDVLNLKHQKNLIVVIPQIVIHELDGLKKDEEIGVKARTAIRFVHDALDENQGNLKRWLRGQSANETISSNDSGFHSMNNDDKIVNCVLYYNKYIGINKTLLLTNDKALQVKVMMNGIRACNIEQFLTELPPIYEISSISESLPSDKNKSNFTDVKNELTQVTYEESALRYLPPSLWKRILGFLDPRSLAAMSAVSTSFYRLANEDIVWRNSVKNTFKDKNDILVPKNVLAKQWYLNWRKNVLTCYQITS